jgi:DNA-binding XRE family transcriptional regulator
MRYFSSVTKEEQLLFICSMKTRKTKEGKTKEVPSEIFKIGARLKSLRIKKGFTSYEAFAYDYGLSRALYGRYEKGKDLRISSLIKIIKAFDMTLEEFFSEGFD